MYLQWINSPCVPRRRKHTRSSAEVCPLTEIYSRPTCPALAIPLILYHVSFVIVKRNGNFHGDQDHDGGVYVAVTAALSALPRRAARPTSAAPRARPKRSSRSKATYQAHKGANEGALTPLRRHVNCVYAKTVAASALPPASSHLKLRYLIVFVELINFVCLIA